MESNPDPGNHEQRRILIIGPAHPFRGGIASFNERLANALANTGHKVKIANFIRQYPGFLFPGKSQYSSAPPPEHIDISRWIHAYNPFNWPVAARRIREWQPDLIIVAFWLPLMGMSLGSVLRLVKRKFNIPVIGLMHNMIPHESRPGDLIFSRYFLKILDAAVALSDPVRDDVLHFEPALPVRVHPHPVYDHFGKPLPKEDALRDLGLSPGYRYLLFFGIIREYKGLDLFIRMMADKRLEVLRVKGIIAGEFYEDETPYYQLIEQLQLKERLILNARFIPDDQVALYFSAADMVVLPYKHATQSGITQIAYAFEKPLLVTGTGGLRQIVEHEKNGYIVEADPEALANAVVDFYENRREIAFASYSARLKEKYSWAGFINALLQLYVDIKQTTG
jgi:glycosyltransferase involved in cell wall biosynthesis